MDWEAGADELADELDAGKPKFAPIPAHAPSVPRETSDPWSDENLDAAIDAAGDERLTKLRESIAFTKDKDPARYSEILRLQLKTGLPPELIAEQFDLVKQETEAQAFDPEKLRRENPIVSSWLADPRNMVVARDDAANLSGLEWIFGRWKFNPALASPGLPGGIATGLVRERAGAVEAAYRKGDDQVRVGNIGFKQILGTATPEELTEAKALEDRMRRDFGAEGWLEKGLTGSAEMFPQTVNTVKKGGAGAAAGAVVGGTVGAVVGGVTTEGVGAIPGAMSGAKVGANIGGRAGAAYAAFQQEGGLALREFLEIKGPDGRTVDPDAARAAAIVVGAVNAGLEVFALETLVKNMPGGNEILGRVSKDSVKRILARPTIAKALADLVKRYGENIGTETLTEIAQEGTNIIAGELLKEAGDLDPRPFGPRFAEAVTRMQGIAVQTLQTMTVFGAAGPAGTLVTDMQRIEQSRQDEALMTALADNANSSKLRERLPEKYQEVAAAVAEQGGAPNIYADREAWNAHFQSVGVDPREVYGEVVGDTKGYDEATARGGDLVIPTAAWASKLAPTEHHAALAGDVSLTIDGLTPRKRAEIEANPEKALKAFEEQFAAEVERIQTQENATSSSAFYRGALDSAIAAGVDTQIAERQLVPLRALINVQTENFNRERVARGAEPITADELFAGYSVEFTTEGPQLVAPPRVRPSARPLAPVEPLPAPSTPGVTGPLSAAPGAGTDAAGTTEPAGAPTVETPAAPAADANVVGRQRFEEVLARAREQVQARKQLVGAVAAGGEQAFQAPTNREGEQIIVHRTTSGETQPWRVTRLVDGVPTGHTVAATYEKALEDALEEGADFGRRTFAAVEPATAAPEGTRTARAETFAFSTANPDEQLPFRYRVVSIHDLVTSNDGAGNPNPAYPQELQQWNRASAASRAQVSAIAGSQSFANLLVEQHALDRGTPIIGPEDQAVESGNGRTMALREAASAGTPAWQEYQRKLAERAADLGLSLEGVQDPILVRERAFPLSPEERIEFTRDANGRASREPSVVERAKMDAERLTPELIASLPLSDQGSIDDALTGKAGAAWMREFLAGLPSNEYGRFVDANGNVGAHGIAALKLALFYRVFGAGYGERILRSLTEVAGEQKANLERALMGSLPRLAQMRGAIEAGALEESLDVGPDIAKAIDVFRRLRAEGTTVEQYLQQGALFARELDPFQEELLGKIEENARKGSRLAAYFGKYAEDALALPPPDQGALFGETARPDKAELWNGAVAALEEDTRRPDDSGQGMLLVAQGALPQREAETFAELHSIVSRAEDERILEFAAQDPEGPLAGFERNPVLDDEERAIETRFAMQLLRDPEGMAARYAENPATFGGKVVNADDVKALSPEFQGNQALAGAVHEPSSAFAKYLWRRALKQAPVTGRTMLMAGGGGSGKTTALRLRPEDLANHDVILDATLARSSQANTYIESSKASGRTVRLTYVYVPVEQAIKQAVARAGRTGRVVDLQALAAAHKGAQETFLQLAEKTPDGVEMLAVAVEKQEDGKLAPRIIDLAEVASGSYSSIQEVQRRAYQAWLAQFRGGAIRPDHVPTWLRGLERAASALGDSLGGELEAILRGGGGGGAVSVFGQEALELPSGNTVTAADAVRRTGGSTFTLTPDERGAPMVVVHNLGEESLRYALSRLEGQLAAPSLAVVNAKAGFTNFGQISLIGPPELVDPRQTPVFDSDSYTPRHPEVRSKLADFREKDVKRLLDLLWSLERRSGARFNAKYVVRSRIVSEGGIRFAADMQMLARTVTREQGIPEDAFFKAVAAAWALERGRLPKRGTIVPSQLEAAFEPLYSEEGKADFQDWIRERAGESRKQSVIDYYTARSDKEKTIPFTPENVVRAMRARGIRGGEFAVPDSTGSVRAQGNKRFRSMKQLRADRGRLVTEDAFEEIAKATNAQGRAAAEALGLNGQRDANAIILEWFESGRRTNLAALVRETVPDATDQAVEQLREYADALVNAPAPYFEAKPQRLVDLSEFRVAIVPEELAGSDLVAQLEARGLEVQTYEDTQDRIAKIEAAGERAQVLFQDEGAGTPPGTPLKGKRGYLAFQTGKTGPRVFKLGLLEKADLSTVLHETGHLFLELMGDLAEREDAPLELRKDYQGVLKWLGVANRDAIGDAQHERFAKGFELYLLEGKAPSASLRAVFRRYKAWLTNLYKQIMALYFGEVELTDEVRGVFDRLLASREEIEKAELVAGAEGMFPDAEAAGMSDAEYAAYRRLSAAAHEEALEDLEQQVMEDVRREADQEVQRRKAEIREQLRLELDSQPVQRAIAMLRRNSLPDGSPLPEGVPRVQFNRGLLVQSLERIGAADQLGKKFAFTAVANGGVHPDIVAEMYGFGSGDELLRAMLEAPARSSYLAEETQRRLEAELGSLMQDAQRRQEAGLDAVHGDRRGEVLLAELKALSRRAGKRGPTAVQLVRQFAERAVRGKRLMDLDLALYRRDEKRAGQEAVEALATGDYEVALAAKKRQLLAYYLHREASRAKDEAQKGAAYLHRMKDPKARARIGKAGFDYLEQIDAILDRYEFRTGSKRQSQRREALAAWLEKRKAEDFADVVMDPRILDEARRVTWRELTVDELLAVRDAVKNIEALARRKNELLSSKGRRDFEKAIEELTRGIRQNLPDMGRTPTDPKDETAIRRALDFVKLGHASLTRLEELFRRMDGGDPDGPWSRYVWNILADAQSAEADLTLEVTGRLMKAYEKLAPEQRSRMDEKVEIRSLGKSMRREWILAVAMNTGNASNVQRLMETPPPDVQRWDADVLSEILGTLSREDWDFVQDTWDTLEGLWPKIAALEKRLTGIAPPKVERVPFTRTFPDGTTKTYEGGYYPLVYDRRHGGRAGQLQAEAEDVAGLFHRKYVRAITPHGHTIARVENVKEPLLLDLEIVPRHLQAVVHDLTHREAILSIYKVLTSQPIREALYERLGEAQADLFLPWLKSIANDRVDDTMGGGTRFFERISKRARNNVSVVAMGYRAGTALQNFANFANVLEKVPAGQLSKALKTFLRNPAAGVRFVHERSGEMRHRFNNLDRDVREQIDRVLGKGDALSNVKRFAFHFMAYTDAIAAYPAWLGAYTDATRQGKTEQEAIRHADRTVRLTLGAGGVKDLSELQRRGEAWRWLTMFYSFFNVTYNRFSALGFDAKTAYADGRLAREMPKLVARSLAFWIVPAILSEFLLGRGPDPDDDEEGFLEWASVKALVYPFLTIPLVREMASQLERGFGPRPHPAVQAGEAIVKLLTTSAGVVSGEKEIEDLVKPALRTAGYGAGLPTGQLEVTGGYLWDLYSGEADADSPSDVARGILFSQPPKR